MSRRPSPEGLVLAALAIVVAWGLAGLSHDDAFITFRYARSWLEGAGLVFNPGERVFGTSAPGYALLLAWLARGLAPLGLDIPEIGTLVSVASLLVIVALAARGFGSTRSGRLATLVFGALALTSPIHGLLLGGELFPVLALVVAASHALLRARRPALAALLVALAVAMRLDAGVAAIVLGLVAWREERRPPLVFAVLGGVGVLAWLAVLLALFGTVVPNTLGGKAALAEVPITLRQWQTLGLAYGALGRVVLLAGALAGAFLAWRSRAMRDPWLRALVLWGVALELVYRLVGVWYAPWYHGVLWSGLLALFAAAVSHGERRALPLVAVAMLLVPSLSHLGERWRDWSRPELGVYAELGERLRVEAEPDARVLALEIGVLGWTSGLSVLDLGALVSPDFTAAKRAGTRAALVAERMPEWIVTGAGEPLVAEALASSKLAGRYREAARHGLPDGRAIRLLRRVDGP